MKSTARFSKESVSSTPGLKSSPRFSKESSSSTPGQPHQIPLTRKHSKSGRPLSRSDKTIKEEIEKKIGFPSRPRDNPRINRSNSASPDAIIGQPIFPPPIVSETPRSFSTPLPSSSSSPSSSPSPTRYLSASSPAYATPAYATPAYATPVYSNSTYSPRTRSKNFVEYKPPTFPKTHSKTFVEYNHPKAGTPPGINFRSNSSDSLIKPSLGTKPGVSLSSPADFSENPTLSQTLLRHCRTGIQKLFPKDNYYEYRIKFPQNETLEHFLNRVFANEFSVYRDYLEIHVDSHQTLVIRKNNDQNHHR